MFKTNPTVTVLVTRSVVLEMFRLVQEFPNIETSWGLGGIIYPQVDSFALITNVILPSSHEITRGPGVTKIGGNHMANCVDWLQDQYPIIREKCSVYLPQYLLTEFVFFGKGHSHHVLGLKNQSGTDEKTTKESVTIDGLTICIAPLANIVSNPSPFVHTSALESFVSIYQNTRIQLRFYVYTKSMADEKVYSPILVTPTIVEDFDAPISPIESWHLLNPEDYAAQLDSIDSYGCKSHSMNLINQKKDGLDLQIMIEHPSWSGILIITTDKKYPSTRPDIRIIDLKKPKGTRSQFHSTNPKLKLGEIWSMGDTLLDIVLKHEARGLL